MRKLIGSGLAVAALTGGALFAGGGNAFADTAAPAAAPVAAHWATQCWGSYYDQYRHRWIPRECRRHWENDRGHGHGYGHDRDDRGGWDRH